MVFDAFRAILCCCRSSEKNEDRETYDDERIHLIIPETIESTHTEEARSNQRQLRERLTEIVRSTEGKMVNVASQLPFNLHNRAIIKTQSLSSSQLTLDSVIPYHDPLYSDFYSSRDIARLRKERSKYCHGLGRLRSASPSFHASAEVSPARTRSPSPEAEQPVPVRPLNIRLVGYNNAADPGTRGRARERNEQRTTGFTGERELESPVAAAATTTTTKTVEVASDVQGSASAEDSPSSARGSETFTLQFPDVKDMIITWD